MMIGSRTIRIEASRYSEIFLWMNLTENDENLDNQINDYQDSGVKILILFLDESLLETVETVDQIEDH